MYQHSCSSCFDAVRLHDGRVSILIQTCYVCYRRLHQDGQGEINSVKAKIEEGGEAQAGLEAEMQTKDTDIQTLQASLRLGAHIWEHQRSSRQC